MRLARASTYVLASIVLCTPGLLEAQSVRASVTATGAQALGGTWVAGTEVDVSADGRVVVFDSPVDTLVPGDDNGVRDVFVLADGVISRALPTGIQPASDSSHPVVSGDGRFVVFATDSANLTPGDYLFTSDIFLFDRQNPTALTLVSVTLDGQPSFWSATRPAISDNGRYVAFLGNGTAYAPGPVAPSFGTLAYRRDLQTGTTVAVGIPIGAFPAGRINGAIAVANTGEVAFNYCPDSTSGNFYRCDAYVANPDTGVIALVSVRDQNAIWGTQPDRVSISADGRFVSFTGLDLAFAGQAIVVRDRVQGVNIVASRPLPGQQVDGVSRDATISPDGRYVTFFSSSTNLTTTPAGTAGLYRTDLQALTIVSGLVPIGPSNSQRARRAAPANAAVTAAGTVVFVSDADDLVPADDNHATDLFAAPAVGPVTRLLPGGGFGRSARPALDHDGTHVAFISTAANLVEGDDNQVADVFVKHLGTGAVERIEPGPEVPVSPAVWVALSDDARFVAFNQSGRVWLYDRTLETRVMVGSVMGDLTTTDYSGASRVAISGDGRYVAFTTLEPIDPADTNVRTDVYVFDRVTASRRRVSLRDNGTSLWNQSYQPSISGDGRFVSFLGVDFDTTGVSGARAFVRDRDADGDGILDETDPGASRTYLRPPFDPSRLAVGATLSRDGRRLQHVGAWAPDSSLMYEDAPVLGTGIGLSWVYASQPYATIARTPNVPALSASARLMAWVSTNAAQSNAAVRPHVALDGFGALHEDLSAALNGGPCTGGHVRSTANPVISGNGRVVAFESGCVDIVAGDTNGMVDVFVTPTGKADDREPAPGYRAWAAGYGLDPDQASGSPWADTDDDGRTNLAEFTASPSSDPTLGRYQRYFAEGATHTPLLPFTTRIALANPHPDPTPVRIEYALGSGAAPPTELTLAPWQRTTVVANAQPGLGSAEFGFRVLATRPIAIDRTMTWDADTYAGHSDAGAPRPSLTWYFAEGATIAGFQLFYLMQNPSATAAADVEVRFLLATGAAVTRRYTVAPASRFNVWANAETGPGGTRPLANQEISAEIRVLNGVPIVAERAMYRDIDGRLFKAGHESSGVVAPAPEWFLAEGNGGDFFDFFVLMANPSDADARVQVDYLLGSGQVITRTLLARANSRTTIWVDELEEPAGSGLYPFRTGQTDISVRVRSLDGIGIVVERAMWWPGQGDSWREAHNSTGAITTASRWIVAEGEVSALPAPVPTPTPTPPPAVWDTYVLVANTGAMAGTVRVTLMVEGLVAPIVVSHTAVAASSRTTFSLRDLLAAALIPSGRAAVLIEAIGGDLPLVVERAMYVSRGSRIFEAGMNGPGTPLTP